VLLCASLLRCSNTTRLCVFYMPIGVLARCELAFQFADNNSNQSLVLQWQLYLECKDSAKSLNDDHPAFAADAATS
jgi:hypothetical protein